MPHSADSLRFVLQPPSRAAWERSLLLTLAAAFILAEKALPFFDFFSLQLLSQAAWERSLLLTLAAAFILAEKGAQKLRAAVQV